MNPSDISSSFQQSDSGFKISGLDLEEIVHTTGTPVFVYDAETIRNKYHHLRENLPTEVDIFYAMKANPALAVVKLLTNMGTGVEVASRGELLACQMLDINPENIVFAGPSKTDEDLRTAIDMQIRSINVESFEELKRISHLAQIRGITARVELRINPEFEVKGATVNMGGGPKKFGIDAEKLDDRFMADALGLPNINIQGLHVFSATGILNQEGFLQNLESCFSLGAKLNKYFLVKSIDVGGGLGIPYKDGERELSIAGIRDKILQMFETYWFIRDNGTRIILEPGRYLVGQSGIYVTRVEYTKDSRGVDYVLIDGGIHHLLRPALIGSSHPTFNLTRRSAEETSYGLGGCLCTSTDFLAEQVKLPLSTSRNDLIGIFCSGAYGFTEGMPLFLSHDIPAEVLVHNNTYSIIRPKVPIEEVLNQQIVPDNL
ncbi:diaminopimelate decarboxylase [Candidatus Woesearchaeota archaeon]|nr:diaminopimelate decarboxylase [Candidatus Woesearchaeota archaeon]